MDIFAKYCRIIDEEAALSGNPWDTHEVHGLYNTVKQIAEFAKSATVLRDYNRNYYLTRQTTAFESASAHSNLVAAMVDRALSWHYGPAVQFTNDGYSYREIMEAIRRHDLSENVTGDIPDDGDRDEAAKNQAKREYQSRFSALYSEYESGFESKVSRLLIEMEERSSLTGRLLYTANKASAIIMALCYEELGSTPFKTLGRPYTDRDRQEFELCSLAENDLYYASEMWTIDYIKLRQLIEYDDTGFFTALIVMYTLKVHQQWYSWRERDYSKNYSA